MSESRPARRAWVETPAVKRKRDLWVVLVLAVVGPVLVFAVEAVMLQAGIGGLSEIAGILADQEPAQERDQREVFLATGKAGESYLAGQIFLRAPIIISVLAIAYFFVVRRPRWFDHGLLALPMALFVSWPLPAMFLWTFALYFALSAVIGMSARWLAQQVK